MRYFTLLFLLVSFTGRAQSLQGYVTDATTSQPLATAIVVNVRTQATTSTDTHGFYSIPAQQGDDIAFSYIGYQTTVKKKPISIIVATLNVLMEQQNYELKEFKIHANPQTKYQIDSARAMGTYKKMLGQTAPSPFSSPVSALADLFNKKSGEIRRFKTEFAQGEREKFIDTRYTTELVGILTKLQGDDIAHFMYANPMPYDFARAATDLEVKIWIRECFKSWIKTAVLDTASKPIVIPK